MGLQDIRIDLPYRNGVSTQHPPQCQKVFVLKKVHGYSHKEIAKELEISISTVEKHAASGLKRCSEYMELHQAGIDQQDKVVEIAKPEKNLVVAK